MPAQIGAIDSSDSTQTIFSLAARNAALLLLHRKKTSGQLLKNY
jgi:hypothetical protein